MKSRVHSKVKEQTLHSSFVQSLRSFFFKSISPSKRESCCFCILSLYMCWASMMSRYFASISLGSKLVLREEIEKTESVFFLCLK